MSNQIKKSDLEQLLAVIRRRSGDNSYEIGYAYGKPRLYRSDMSVEVSPRLSKGDLYTWMSAYAAGMDDCKCR